MEVFDEIHAAAMETLNRLLNAAADLRETLEHTAQERRKALLVKQSLAELEEIKDSFVAIISHELRTPVGVVSNGAELLRRRLSGRVDEVEQELLNSVQQQSRHLATLVRELTEFNDLSSMHQTPLSADALHLAIDAAVNNVSAVAEARTIELRVSLPAEIPPFVGDWQRLRVVLENLLANAVRFTPNGGLVELRIALRDAQIYLSVRDSGAGIPAAQLARIFDSFRQAEDPNTRHYGGLGLGLSIIQRAIYSMGGTITVESRVGMGSTFTVILPLGGQLVDDQPEPTSDLRSTLLGHIQRMQVQIDTTTSYVGDLESQLVAWQQAAATVLPGKTMRLEKSAAGYQVVVE